jgi:DHA1 family inner membrane transport protein
MTDSRTVAMLVAFSAATFMVTSSGSSTAPFLQAIAGELSVDLAAVAQFFTLQAILWGTASLVAGTLSDRLGRRVILVGSVVLIGCARIAFATSQNYALALMWQVVTGVGGGAFMGTVFATVSDHVPAGSRGRALGWVITGQSLSLVVGVPLITLLGSLGGWRGALATHGALTVLTAVGVRLVTPAAPAHKGHPGKAKTPWRQLGQPRLVALLAAGTTERICFSSLVMYLPTYLQRAYGVSLAPLAFALALVALGSLSGNVVGGRIADRTRSRGKVFSTVSLIAAGLAVPTLMWHPGLLVSVVLGFAYSFACAVGRPAVMATLAEVPSELRGALFGINITMASMGWLVSGSVGAGLIAAVGFPGLGAFCSAVALAGAALGLASARASRRSMPAR